MSFVAWGSPSSKYKGLFAVCRPVPTAALLLRFLPYLPGSYRDGGGRRRAKRVFGFPQRQAILQERGLSTATALYKADLVDAILKQCTTTTYYKTAV